MEVQIVDTIEAEMLMVGDLVNFDHVDEGGDPITETMEIVSVSDNGDRVVVDGVSLDWNEPVSYSLSHDHLVYLVGLV